MDMDWDVVAKTLVTMVTGYTLPIHPGFFLSPKPQSLSVHFFVKYHSRPYERSHECQNQHLPLCAVVPKIPCASFQWTSQFPGESLAMAAVYSLTPRLVPSPCGNPVCGGLGLS